MTFVSGTTPPPVAPPPEGPAAPQTDSSNAPEGAAKAPPGSSRLRLSGRDMAAITAVSLVIAFAIAIAVVTFTNKGSSDAVPDEEFLTPQDTGAAAGSLEVGNPVPNLDLKLFDGTTTTLDDLLDRPMVVNVWASTCTPCLREMPDFEAVHQDLGDSVSFVGIDSGESKADGQPFADKLGITYPLAEDPEQVHSNALDLVALPMTLFINTDGTLAHRRLGAMDEAALRSNIEKYLKVPSA